MQYVFAANHLLDTRINLEPLLQHASVEEQATCFVLQNYVSKDNDTLAKDKSPIWGAHEEGLFTCLPGMFGGVQKDRYLEDAVIALGLAGISNTRHEAELMRKAGLRYTSAVRGISAKLGQTDEAMKDEILTAVLLLGLYETNSSNKPSSMRYWTQHTTGAASLLSLRGEAQLKTPTGHRIFTQIRGQAIKSCLQRRIPVPESITRLSLLALPHESPFYAAATRFSFIVTRFCALRAPLPPTFDINPYTDMLTIQKVVKEAAEIDQQLEKWVQEMPDGCQYQILQTPEKMKTKEDERGIFGDTYHVYTDIYLASLWNSYRSIRILVLELLLNYITYLPPTPLTPISPCPPFHPVSSPQNTIEEGKAKVEQLCNDILSSVPYHFNTHLLIQSKLWTRPPPRALNGELMMWALYTCAVGGLASCAPPEIARIESEKKRRWICARLRAVAREMGVLHASALAMVAGMAREVSVWDRENVESMSPDSVGSGEVDEQEEDWEAVGVTRLRTPYFQF
ncbi:hypothetical protein BDZ45DRAFT_592297 [Acephala macrosclerotiorum]|nr:hypothetical protein BDZ45DRAFT_592297 [Acephala macrosclerotiorum]